MSADSATMDGMGKGNMSFMEHVRWIRTPSRSVPLLIIFIVVLILNILIRNQHFDCAGVPVPLWKVFIVMDGIIAMVTIMGFGAPAEVVLIFGATIYSLIGIITTDQVLGGLSNSTVTSVALLFPMARACSESGFLSAMVGLVLGNPKSQRIAIVRVCLLTALMGAVFNYTPTVAAMMPILVLWCQRLGFDVRVFALPMGFASQLGGTLTLMGNPANFASKASFLAYGYNYSFWELTIPGLIMLAFGTTYFAVLAPMMFGSKEEEEEDDESDEDLEGNSATASGVIQDAADNLDVVPSEHPQEETDAPFKGESNASLLTLSNYGTVLSVGSVGSVGSNDSGPGRAEKEERARARRDSVTGNSKNTSKAREEIARGGGVFQICFEIDTSGPFVGSSVKGTGFHKLPGVVKVQGVFLPETGVLVTRLKDVVLASRDIMVFKATAEGVAALRHTRGITMSTEKETRLLGAGRRDRRLFEVELPMTSRFMDSKLDAASLRLTHKCVLVALRTRAKGKAKGPGEDAVPLSTFDGVALRPGHVLLIETGKEEPVSSAWCLDFGIARVIPDSAPPRTGRLHDQLRTAVAILGSLTAILIFVASQTVVAVQNFTLTNNLIILMVVFLVTRNFRLDDIFGPMERSVLLTIVGAMPLSYCIPNVGLDVWIATGLTRLLGPAGHFGICLAVTIVSAALTQLISNIAVIAVMAPIAFNMAQQSGLSLRVVVPLMTMAVSAVFTCPIGDQTNQMVTPLGRYSWGDFIKFGGSFQVCHNLVLIPVCMYCTIKTT